MLCGLQTAEMRKKERKKEAELEVAELLSLSFREWTGPRMRMSEGHLVHVSLQDELKEATARTKAY